MHAQEVLDDNFLRSSECRTEEGYRSSEEWRKPTAKQLIWTDFEEDKMQVEPPMRGERDRNSNLMTRLQHHQISDRQLRSRNPLVAPGSHW